MFRFVSNYNYIFIFIILVGESLHPILPHYFRWPVAISLSISVPGVVNWVRVPGNVCLNKYCISVAVFLFKGVPSRPA